MDERERLMQQSEQVKNSGLLGQSRLLRLFDYLVNCSKTDQIPKEAVIAIEVFDKSPAFDASQDSSVRVYMHNLRRKLELYYSTVGREESFRIVLPKSEYRLVLLRGSSATSRPDVIDVPFKTKLSPFWFGVLAGVAISIVVAVTGQAVHGRAGAYVARNQYLPWSKLFENDKPIVVVLGDYYIFADTENTTDVKRLVREFSINSGTELERYLQVYPETAGRYMDVGLAYLPTASAVALSFVTSLLARGHREVQIQMMSSFDPNTLNTSNVIYVGLFSGLGELQPIVFSASRFQIGSSYDDLFDRQTRRHYFSSANRYYRRPAQLDDGVGYHDYGLIQTFAGLHGNEIVIIAATQDEGLRQMAQIVTDPKQLHEIAQNVRGATDFEGLFDVLGLQNQALGGKLLVASRLDAEQIWKGKSSSP